MARLERFSSVIVKTGNGRRLTCCGRLRKHWIGIPIQSRFPIHLFNAMTREYLCTINVPSNIQIDSKY